MLLLVSLAMTASPACATVNNTQCGSSQCPSCVTRSNGAHFCTKCVGITSLFLAANSVTGMCQKSAQTIWRNCKASGCDVCTSDVDTLCAECRTGYTMDYDTLQCTKLYSDSGSSSTAEDGLPIDKWFGCNTTTCPVCVNRPDGVQFCTHCMSAVRAASSKTGWCQWVAPEFMRLCNTSNCAKCSSDDIHKCAECKHGFKVNDYMSLQCIADDSATTTSTAAPPPTTKPTTTTTTTTSTTTTRTPAPATTTPAPATTTPAPATTTPAPATTTPAPTVAPPCTVANCVVCAAGNPYACQQCITGQTISASGKCMVSGSCNVANCAQCYPNDNLLCSTCNQGYVLTASSQCLSKRRPSATSGPAGAALLTATALLLAVSAAVTAA